MIICPKCNGNVEFNSYFQKYQCLSKGCNWYLDPKDMTDEDKLYFNRQERYDRWELDEPISDIRLYDYNYRKILEEEMIQIQWKDGTFQVLTLEQILKILLKRNAKEIKAIK